MSSKLECIELGISILPSYHFGFPICQNCIGGQVVAGSCIMCGAEHDEQGQLIRPVIGDKPKSEKPAGRHDAGGKKLW